MTLRWGLAFMTIWLLSLGCAFPAPARPVDRSALALVFDESFDSAPSFWDAKSAPQGRWKTNYFFGVQNAEDAKGWSSRTLEPNGELQYYAEPGHEPVVFQCADGVLSIWARANSGKGDPLTHGLPYLSGLITTEKSFSQSEGYFEARMAFPVGKGLWPAFWLLPDPVLRNGQPVDSGGQEIDIVESIGEPGTIYHTVFADRNGAKVRDAQAFATHADLSQFHTYGVLVTRAQIVWYFDDVEVRRVANTDFHRPAYMLVNLAVGGTWPGSPPATTRFPAALRIDWIRAYRLKGKGL